MKLKQLIKLQTACQPPGVLIGSSELKFAKSMLEEIFST